MPIGVTQEHDELARSFREWAGAVGGPALVRTVEGETGATFSEVWRKVSDQGVPTIAVPEAAGGGGGSMLDAAVVLEACARELLPGPVLGTSVAAAVLATSGADPLVGEVAGGVAAGFALEPSLEVGERVRGEALVYDLGGAGLLLLGGRGDGAEHWFAIPIDDLADDAVEPAAGPDLTRRAGRVRVDLARADLDELTGVSAASVRRLALTLAAAEAAGVASWCLDTAVEYAKLREQFGRPIGSFQAIKHLCAQMLEVTEATAASAWDAATAAGDTSLAGEQWDFAAEVAAVTALDGAVRVAQDCIQVLGGIGFTFEHDAHLYLRRAVTLRSLFGGTDRSAISLARRAVAGHRRRLHVDLEGTGSWRDRVRAEVGRIAALPAAEQRQALVDSGYLAPHWPAPAGVGAGPAEQLVIDEELTAAGVTRPDLAIGAWALPTILEHGSEAQRERFVRPTLLGELTWCQLFSEPGAGSDLASLATRAERVEGGWRLTGQKVWTSLAGEADWAICLARTDPDAPQHRGISYFLVDMRAAGIEVRPLRELTGDALFNEVFLDGVFVPDEDLVAEPGAGWKLARTTLANERVAMASTRLGTSVERAVQLAAADGSEQALNRVGRAVALATVCAQLGARTTCRSLAGQGPGAEASVAKLLGVRSRQEASELAVELHGPEALLQADAIQADVHEMLLTRCLSIAGGTTQVLRNVAAERILGLPR